MRSLNARFSVFDFLVDLALARLLLLDIQLEVINCFVPQLACT